MFNIKQKSIFYFLYILFIGNSLAKYPNEIIDTPIVNPNQIPTYTIVIMLIYVPYVK